MTDAPRCRTCGAPLVREAARPTAGETYYRLCRVCEVVSPLWANHDHRERPELAGGPADKAPRPL